MFFITWAPNPDPLYHNAGESPKEMPIQPPLLPISIPTDGYALSLDHLIGGRAKRKFREVAERCGLHNVLKFKGPILLDSGGYQNKYRKPSEVLEFQSIFKPNAVIHMDVMGNYKKTVENARTTKELEESFDFDIFYVVQGKEPSEYKKCATSLLEMGCEKFAIGNLAYLSYLRKLEELRKRITVVKKIIGNRPLHLLGVSNPRLILELKNEISSFDSSTGIRNAARLREVFLLKNAEFRYFRKLNKKPNEFNCNCPVCKIYDIFENEYNYPVGTGERRKVRYMRALHNTFMLWKAVHQNEEF